MAQAAKLSYSVEQAAEVTGLNRSAIYRAIKEEWLVTFKVGKRRLVSAEALRDFVRRLERASGGRVPA